MPHAPIPLFLTLVVIMLVTAVVTIHIRTRHFGFRPNKWTWIAWALLAAVMAYFLVQGLRHP